jgi:hypothetical protein
MRCFGWRKVILEVGWGRSQSKEQVMTDSRYGLHLSGWRALTPPQRNALMWQLARRAHAARARAIGDALRSALGHVIGRLTSAVASPGTPASARCRQRPRLAPRGREF